MEVKQIEIIAEWLKRYRKMCPGKTQRKHVHEFLRVSKLYFEENNEKLFSASVLSKDEENKELSNWDIDWQPLVSSFYLTYTIW